MLLLLSLTPDVKLFVQKYVVWIRKYWSYLEKWRLRVNSWYSLVDFIIYSYRISINIFLSPIFSLTRDSNSRIEWLILFELKPNLSKLLVKSMNTIMSMLVTEALGGANETHWERVSHALKETFIFQIYDIIVVRACQFYFVSYFFRVIKMK